MTEQTFTQRFEIQYRDPETEEWVTEELDFSGTKEFPPKGWAEDYAYARADKGAYRIREILPYNPAQKRKHRQ